MKKRANISAVLLVLAAIEVFAIISLIAVLQYAQTIPSKEPGSELSSMKPGAQVADYCGDGSCRADLGEDCSNCPVDCGACGGGGGGGGGGSLGAPEESTSLATASRKIYFADSINVARTDITSSELPTALADETFTDLIGIPYTYSQVIVLGDTVSKFGTSGGDIDEIAYVGAPFYLNAYKINRTGIGLEIKNNGGETYNITQVSVSNCNQNTNIGNIDSGATISLVLECSLTGATFSGDITINYKKIGSAIDLASTGLISGTVEGGASLDDPILYIDAGTTATDPLYNYSLFFNRNLNVSDAQNVQGQKISILGRDYVIGPGSTNTTLYLYGSGETIVVHQDEPQIVRVGGVEHLIELITTTGTNTAKISVDGTTRSVMKDNLYAFEGDVVVYIKDVTHPAFEGDLRSVELIVGVDLLKLENGKKAKRGLEEASIKETNVDIDAADDGYISGFTIQVAMASSAEDHIASGHLFIDPVFWGISLKFVGETPSLDSETRERIKIDTDYDRLGYVTFTSARAGNAGEQKLTYAYDNDSSSGVKSVLAHQIISASDKGYIRVVEGENAKEGDWIVVNQGDTGTIVEVDDIENDPDALTIDVTLTDAITGMSYTYTLMNETGGFTKSGVMFGGVGYTLWVNRACTTINITWDFAATNVFPRIKLQNGGWISFLTDTLINNGTKVIFPDGNTTITNTETTLSTSINSYDVNGVRWITRDTNDKVDIYAIDSNLDGFADCVFDSAIGPSIIFLEPRKWDDVDHGDFICVPLTTTGGISPEIKIGLPVISGINSGLITYSSDISKKEAVDKYGTLLRYEDRTDENGVATILYPNSQMYLDINMTSVVEVSCNDSDGGLDYYKKGNVSGNIGSGYPYDIATYVDYCLDSNNLSEKFCSRDYRTFIKIYNCPNGCYDGACLMASCTADSNCTYLTGTCGAGKCNLTSGSCYIAYNQTTDLCRNNVSECDAAEMCSGSNANCPVDVNKSDSSSCFNGTCQGGTCIQGLCVNDTGCASVGIFCQGNTPYNCTKGSDGCLDRTNLTTCSSGHSCVSGTCQDSDDDDNDGGNGGTTCTPRWNCTWTACQGGKQTYKCNDLNKCGKTAGMPTTNGTTKSCSVAPVAKNCTDGDGDGYGVGKDCLGPDIDDNNASITNTVISYPANENITGKFAKALSDNLIYIVIGLAFLIVLVAIIIVVILIIVKTNKPKHSRPVISSSRKIDKEKDDRFK